MKNVFTKIASLSVGLALAIGVGVAVGSREAKVAKAASGSVEIDYSTVDDCVVAETSQLKYEHTSDGVTATILTRKASSSTNANNYYPGTEGKSYTQTRFYKNSTLTISATNSSSVSVYITSIVFTAATDAYATALANSTWTNANASASSKTVTVTANTNITTVSCTLGGAAGVTSAVVSWTDQTSSAPVINTEAKIDVGVGKDVALDVSYSNISDLITVSSNNGNVSVPSSLNVSGDGETTLQITGVSEGTSTVTLSSGVTSVDVSVKIYGIKTYSRITSAAQLVGNQKFVIAQIPGSSDETTHALGTGTGSNNNNREATEVLVDGSDVKTNSGTLAEVLLEKNGNYFRLKDINSGKYYKGNATASNNYLQIDALAENDLFNWDIEILESETKIKCVGGNLKWIQYNSGSSMFSTYSSNQGKVAIYMDPSDIPVAKNISGISAVNKSVEAGSTVTYTASYLPADATELIVVEVEDDEALTVGSITMSDGVVSFSLTASASVTSETEYSISLKAADHSESVHSEATVTVTVYNPTHTRVNSLDNLYNGAHVIFGESTKKIAAAAQSASGNNVSTVIVGFADDGSSLSNVAGNAKEFIAWEVTVGDYSGWAFYSEGTYLVSTDSTSNYLKRSVKLTENAVFTVSISSGVASIVSTKNAESETIANTMLFNVSSNILSCYKSSASGDGYASVSLYVASAKSDSVVADGYEKFFMHMDSIEESDKGSGLCLADKNNYYGFAKDAYLNELTSGQKSELSEESLERLGAWAKANHDVFDSVNGTFTAVKYGFELDITASNTAIIVIIIAAASTLAFTTLLVFKKKKQK